MARKGKGTKVAKAPVITDEAEIAEQETAAEQDIAEAKTKVAKSRKAKEAKAEKVKLTPEERRAQRDAADRAKRANGEVVRNAAGRLTARGLTCLCGCGTPTVTDEAYFVSGHDAKLRKALLTDGAEIPEIILPFFEVEGTVIAGLTLEGGEIADVKVGGPN
jgi:hypothetical protein